VNEQANSGTDAPLREWTVRGSRPHAGLPVRTVAARTAAEACEKYRTALALAANAPLTAVPAPTQGE
jgi:hypothetical protein